MGIRVVAGIALAAAVMGAVIWTLNRRQEEWDRRMREGSKTMRTHYTDMIAEQLTSFDGEDSPVKHAFEEALEAENRLEQQLASETGLSSS